MFVNPNSTYFVRYCIWSVLLILSHLTFTTRLCMSRTTDPTRPTEGVRKITIGLLSQVLFWSHEDAVQIDSFSPLCLKNVSRTIDLTVFDNDKDSPYELTLVPLGMISVRSGSKKVHSTVFEKGVSLREIARCYGKIEISFHGVTSLRYKEFGEVATWSRSTSTTTTESALSTASTGQGLRPSASTEYPYGNDLTGSGDDPSIGIYGQTLIIIAFVVAGTAVIFFIYCELEVKKKNNDDVDEEDHNATRYVGGPRATAPVLYSNRGEQLRQPERSPSARSPEVDLDLPPSYDDLQENHPPPAYGEVLDHVQTS